MAEEFLNQLWELENSITPENDQRCIICLDDCGSLSPETGLVERLVRLPCHHLVGSRCIATWLHNNNTCPVCRRELFPAQRRPYSEHGDLIELDYNSDFDFGIDDDSDDGDSYQDRLRLDHSVAIIERSSQQLHLSPVACRLSHVIGKRVLNLDVVRYCSRWAKAAMSVFVASHLLDHPVTLEQISRAVGVSRRIIRDTYRLFYPERETVIDGECLLLLRQDSERSTTESPAPLSWPRPEYTDAIWEMIASELGIEPEAMLIEISRRLFLILVDKAYFDAGRVMDIAALSIYLTSCLRLIHVSCGEIASATGSSVGAIRTIYASFYPHRQDLLEHRAVNTAWMDNDFERLLNALPREAPSLIEQ